MNSLKSIFTSKYFAIFLLTFVNGLSFTMLFPVLPFVIKIYDQPEFILWILLATFSLFQLFAAPVLWTLSDRYGRKPILVATQAWTMLSWIILWVAYLLPDIQIVPYLTLPIFVIFLSRIFDGITWWNASVAWAIIADMTEPSERTKIFGLNSAFMWLAIIIGPALWSLSMSSSLSYLWTAILWCAISLITLFIIILVLKESLTQEDRNPEAKISLKSTNVFAQVLKWWKILCVRYVIIMKLFMFTAFVGYTSISALYLIDFFGFDPLKVWYYLTFTWIFVIFHQSVTIRYISSIMWDRKSLILWMFLMWVGFLSMAVTSSIYIFTAVYFFSVLWITLSWSTQSSLFSRSVSKFEQWEIMWMVTGIESLISVITPIIITLIYASISFSVYYIIAVLPFMGLLVSHILYRNVEFKK